MEPIKKPNGKEIYPPDHIFPGDETGVEQSREITDMSRKAPRDEPTVGEYRSDMLRATLAMEAAAKSAGFSKNGTLLLALGGIVLSAGTFYGGMQVRNSATAGDHDLLIQVKTLLDVETKKSDTVDEYLRDIREDLAAHGLLNKGGSNANTRK